MSSMRNAVQRRNHKERAQPVERQKWGVLEKHKDYSLRAKDYNEKKKRLKLLRQKAAERNPDEFHYGMIKGKTDRNGIKIADRGNPVLSHDTVKLLKTQDASYIGMMLLKTRRVREKLEQELLLLENSKVRRLKDDDGKEKAGNHVIFAASRDEQVEIGSQVALKGKRPKSFKTDDNGGGDQSSISVTGLDNPTLKSKRTSAPRDYSRAQVLDLAARKQAKSLQRHRKRGIEGCQSRLKALGVKEKTLVTAERELDHQRARMSNSVGGVNRAGIRWKIRERKR